MNISELTEYSFPSERMAVDMAKDYGCKVSRGTFTYFADYGNKKFYLKRKSFVYVWSQL